MSPYVTRRQLVIGAAAGIAAPALLWRRSLAQRPNRERMTLLDFDAGPPPQNMSGDGYPHYYDGRAGARGEGGIFETAIVEQGARRGKCLRMRLTEGAFYAQFNPYDRDGNRSFARDYCADPAAWKFNTYNRLRFWIKLPETATPHRVDGRTNLNVGTYVKRIANADRRSDEAGGNHYYHMTNIPALGAWTQVILNMHPDHRRGNSGSIDLGELAHPTDEADRNYFDTFTRFYIQDERPPAQLPADYLIDEIEFYQQAAAENDHQVYALTATHVPQRNRLIVTWRRFKDDNNVRHEVRDAFESIHRLGWEAATPAPDGVIAPLGHQGYNGMLYDTTALPLRDRPRVFIAIKPENSPLFSQIVAPLG